VVTRVLLTGASGFLGRPLLDELAARDADLHWIGRRVVEGIPGSWHPGDLFDSASVAAILERVRPDVVVHLAWIADMGYRDSDLNVSWRDASLKLLDEAQRTGVRRAVGVGSCAEYDQALGVPMTEDAPLSPSSSYGRAKVQVGNAWIAAGRDGPISTAWVRPFGLFGPREYPWRLVPSVARAVLAGSPALLTPGDQVRDFLHTSDAARHLADIVLSDVRGPINLGSGIATTVRALASEVAQAAGRPDLLRPGMLGERADESAAVVADVSRLRHEVGSGPPRPLGEMVSDAVEWWKAHPDGV
jgi:nucleoside-diphosphate-sugar epimerase